MVNVLKHLLKLLQATSKWSSCCTGYHKNRLAERNSLPHSVLCSESQMPCVIDTVSKQCNNAKHGTESPEEGNPVRNVDATNNAIRQNV